MADQNPDDQQPDAADAPPHLQTKDQKGAGPINDPGSGVRHEDGETDGENMGRA